MPWPSRIDALVSVPVSHRRFHVAENPPGTRELSHIIQNLRRFLTPKVYSLGCLASLTAAVLVVIAMVILAEYTKTRGRLMLTTLVLAAYFFTSLGPVWLAQRHPASVVARAGLATGAAALMLLLTGIWGTPDSDAFWKSTAILTLLGLAVAYIAVVELQQGRSTHRLAVKTVALAVLLACLGIAAGIKWPPYWWVFTLVAIAWAGVLLAQALLFLGRWIETRFHGR